MPRNVNSTAITLIPKVQQPQTMKDFRPIACYNTTTYVLGRNIADGILLMQKMVYGYQKMSGKPRCALKVDIMMTYDIVKWSFIWTIMETMGYPERFIAWVKTCFTTTWFSVSINGSLQGHFKSNRGLMKLVVNVSFADDLFLLSGADEESMRLIKYVLAEFGRMSGLHPNLSKSSSYFAGVSDQQANNLNIILGILISVLPVKYLGIPLTTKQLSATNCRGLI
ncbi:hypothetical protein LIER_31456 [Lithospermum erythrorhizon]|uniref:Reverse transcriptase domain-containing protein n=1 Tax=Lithospermum erythrorhizon TaxID=34254 RepID=A0AAV3RUU9_LITER